MVYFLGFNFHSRQKGTSHTSHNANINNNKPGPMQEKILMQKKRQWEDQLAPILKQLSITSSPEVQSIFQIF